MRYWVETQKIVDDPLTEAVNAYKKASELDEKSKNGKKLTEAYQLIGNDLQNRFFNEYFQAKYIDAYHTALQRIDVSELIGVTDTATIFYFYAGFAAMDQSKIDSSRWQLAVDNFEKALAAGYREHGENVGQIYDNLFHAYMNIGEPEKALKIAQTGFEKNPNYEQLRYDLINFYLKRGENEQALLYLEQAVERDPTNAILLFAQGRTLDQLEERDRAVLAYDAAIAIDPTFFDAYFNKGVVYFNHAVKINEQCNDEPTTAGYEKCMLLVVELFEKAVPVLEQALTVKPGDEATMEALKSAYYRLRLKHPEMEAKYEDMTRKLKKE
jgi:tetratricopeptide (TPR) repeat protein